MGYEVRLFSRAETSHVAVMHEGFQHGAYATRVLFPEAMNGKAFFDTMIPAKLLRERLPEAIAAVDQRRRRAYFTGKDDAASLVQMVETAERIERETGCPAIVRAGYITNSWT